MYLIFQISKVKRHVKKESTIGAMYDQPQHDEYYENVYDTAENMYEGGGDDDDDDDDGLHEGMKGLSYLELKDSDGNPSIGSGGGGGGAKNEYLEIKPSGYYRAPNSSPITAVYETLDNPGEYESLSKG